MQICTYKLIKDPLRMRAIIIKAAGLSILGEFLGPAV